MKHLEIFRLELFSVIKKIPELQLLILILAGHYSYGQKNVEHQKLVWYGYYNTLQINQNWKLFSEIQERHFINPVAQHQLVFRSNIDRKLINNWSAMLGMTLFLQSPQDPNSASDLMVPELRPSFGFATFEKVGRLKITHKYQLEARFFHNQEENKLTSGYTFSNLRFRYQIGFYYPILKIQSREKILLKIKDEVMLNIGNNIVKNTFDQNRIYMGFHFVVDSKLAFEIGYLNWYQQTNSGIDYFNRDILRFSVFHNLSLN